MKPDVYQRITNQIICNLEKAGSWQKLWDTPQPVSLNEHRYRGVNHLLLSTSDYESPVWGTFNQVRKNGGAVNKGAKSTMVIFWKKTTYQKIDRETGEISDQPYFLLKYYSVFNARQCTFDAVGQEKINQLAKVSESRFNERFLPAEDIIEEMPDRPKISAGLHDTPCYIPALDEVKIPDLRYFKNSGAYYAALFHELIHSTGAKKRLNRFEPSQFTNHSVYSREELVAELGASFLCAIAGIQPNVENAAAYVKSWLKVLESNPSWIVWAASRAQKACEYIIPAKVPDTAPF